MPASIYEVAKRAGVSISTVSRILNNSASVSEKKVRAVREAMEFYQYQPNQFGRGLVKQRSHIIGVYFPYNSGSVFDSVYNLELLKGIEQILSGQNYSVMLISESEQFPDSAKIPPRFLEHVRQKKIDGLLLSGLSSRSMGEEAFKQILEEGYPVVYIGKRFHEKGINVYAKFESYMCQMLEAVYRHGHRKVLLYLYDNHQSSLSAIETKAKEMMPDLQLQVLALPVLTGAKDALSEDIQRYIVRAGFTAICSPGIEMTQVLLSICGEMQIVVPETVSIISVEHKQGDGQLLYPQISSFYVPAYDMGSGAAELLLDAIENGASGDRSKEYETRYINRKSIKQR